MIQSMTGFAEKSFHSRTMGVKISIKSLNHRFFDWSFKGPAIGDLENRLRALCQGRIHRGRIEVLFDIDSHDPSGWDLKINDRLLERILASLNRISGRLKTDFVFSLDSLLRIPQLIELQRKALTRSEAAFLEKCFLATLAEAVRSRRAEGRKTVARLKKHLKTVQSGVKRVELLARRQPRAVQDKLWRKLKGANGEAALSEERLSEEVSYLSQRYDVSEEIQRLHSHLGAAAALLSSPRREPAGKMLDFIAQELSREANTLNSKSQNIAMTNEGLRIKNEVESIRQQVQNLE